MENVLGLDFDGRLHANCVTARCSIRRYLEMIPGSESNLTIQRNIIKGTKAYATLRADLRRGCLLPPIVLALKNLSLPAAMKGLIASGQPIVETAEALQQISQAITSSSPSDVYIIDGLQRTNAIQQTLSEISDPSEVEAFLAIQLRFELWLDIPFGALAYRMLVLNAGQKPMSIKHQIEVLSMKLEEELGLIPGIDIYKSTEARRRTKAGQFQLAKLAQAFQAWLQGQPNLDVRNAIMEQMLADSAIETLGQSLEGGQVMSHNDGFRRLITWVVEVDSKLPADLIEFFGSDTVLLGLSAALGSAERNAHLKDRAWQCLENMLEKYVEDPSVDHLSIREFDSLRRNIDTTKLNVGQATREMVYSAFQELFVSNGMKPMSECWHFAASRV